MTWAVPVEISISHKKANVNIFGEYFKDGLGYDGKLMFERTKEPSP